MPSLLLQEVSPKSKSTENENLLERRIGLWQNGQESELLREYSYTIKIIKHCTSRQS